MNVDGKKKKKKMMISVANIVLMWPRNEKNNLRKDRERIHFLVLEWTFWKFKSNDINLLMN